MFINRTYNNRLSVLNLPSVFRRLHGNIIMFYKLMHNHFNLDTLNLFSTATLLTTRGHNYKLFKPQVTSRVRSTFLLCRISTI